MICLSARLPLLHAQAGFAAPAAELERRVSSSAAGAESAKELLGRLRPFTSPDFHAALSEALAGVEAETGAPVSLDGASPGYKKFADRVKVRATCCVCGRLRCTTALDSTLVGPRGDALPCLPACSRLMCVALRRRWRRRTSCRGSCCCR